MLKPTQDQAKIDLSKEVNEQIKAFFARGGQIQSVPEGATGIKDQQVFVINGRKKAETDE